MSSSAEDALFEAIEDGDVDAVRRMVAHSPLLIEQTDQYGSTPLMHAACSSERTAALVQALIEAGADINARTKEGYTALHMMVDVNGPSGTGEIPGEIARLLVEAGADLEVRQHWGWTPLMRAAVEGTADELRALVEVGGELDNTFPDHTMPVSLRGRTTLMATIGDPEKTRILIDAGVDVRATDAHGDTALDYARQSLAEAAERGTASHDVADEIRNDALAEMLSMMEEAGMDLDAASPEGGPTPRQSVTRAAQRAFEEQQEAEPYDYRAAVRACISMLESAMTDSQE